MVFDCIGFNYFVPARTTNATCTITNSINRQIYNLIIPQKHTQVNNFVCVLGFENSLEREILRFAQNDMSKNPYEYDTKKAEAITASAFK